jgi:hypothetical protein
MSAVTTVVADGRTGRAGSGPARTSRIGWRRAAGGRGAPGRARRRPRPSRGGQFGRQVTPLPGDQRAAPREQRERELDEVRCGRHRPSRGERPGLPPLDVPGDVLRPRGRHRDAATQADRFDDGGEEPGLLGDRVQQRDRHVRQRGGKRDPGEAAARPQVDDRPGISRSQQWHGRQAVDDVLARDIAGAADGGQVDRLGPREEQADVAVDGGTRVRREVQAEFGETALERIVVGDRQGGRVPDARRERLAPAFQPVRLLLGLAYHAARHRSRSTRLAPAAGAVRSSALHPVRGRVSPCPSWSALPSRPP